MAGLALVAMALVTVAVVPNLRLAVKDLILNPQREVLAKVSGRLYPEGPRMMILKIRSGGVLSLEVFTNDELGISTLIAKIPLFETRDGHFMLQGNATNLALTDVNQDGRLEILAPTYDDQMVPRLNIFRYNEDSKDFDRVTAPENFEP